jgi:DNA-binding NtrC family response regulator
MSGLELARRVSATQPHPHVVLTSAHYDPAILPNVAEQLADEFLPKPIDIERLNDLLSEQCPAQPNLEPQRQGLAAVYSGAPLAQAG